MRWLFNCRSTTLTAIDSIPTASHHIDANGVLYVQPHEFSLLGTGCQTQVTQIETLLPAISISNRESILVKLIGRYRLSNDHRDQSG